jgi:DNA processing protein
MSYIDYINNINYQNFNLYYKGNISLLDKPKIAIVGTRRPSQYSKTITSKLSQLLSKKYVIVSGGAMGIDAIAHSNAKSTIMVSPSSLDIIYPKINKTLIENIAQNHLIISEYEKNYNPRPYSFVQRNRIVVGISEFVIIIEADENSGSMRSFEIAKKLNKKVYVIPHRIGESKGTNYLANTNQAEVIWDIDEFIKSLGINENSGKIFDYNEAFNIYGDKLFEMELNGEITIRDGKVIF